ncbi:MAG: hypothetical protein VW518_03315 [Burkholderiaceae bacterium]
MPKKGLYYNIQQKRKRIALGSGERMRKVGSKGAPSRQDFIDAAKTAKGSSEMRKKMQMGGTAQDKNNPVLSAEKDYSMSEEMAGAMQLAPVKPRTPMMAPTGQGSTVRPAGMMYGGMAKAKGMKQYAYGGGVRKAKMA